MSDLRYGNDPHCIKQFCNVLENTIIIMIFKNEETAVEA